MQSYCFILDISRYIACEPLRFEHRERTSSSVKLLVFVGLTILFKFSYEILNRFLIQSGVGASLSCWLCCKLVVDEITFRRCSDQVHFVWRFRCVRNDTVPRTLLTLTWAHNLRTYSDVRHRLTRECNATGWLSD